MDISNLGRPRNVGWVRAAALLYGDWGTSKAYVIGLGLAMVGYAALPHLLAVSLVTALVGVNYIWICRCFATGGGVYTAAGKISRRLAVVGGLLLLADFIVTASLSCLDAFHYLGFDDIDSKKWAIIAICLMGAVNFMGPKHTGSVAVWLALPTVLVVAALIAAGLPHLRDFHPIMPEGGLLKNWIQFTGMILALSGVEAAASNTGVMRLDPDATPERPSVSQVSRRTVMVVMIEVCAATALLSVLAMCLPASEAEVKTYNANLLRYMAEVWVGPWFGKVVGVVIALLLLSAVNTAIGGMISVLYVMARDGEIPTPFTWLNRFGVPFLPLVAATILPVIVLDLTDTVESLASLYAIGVVGAIVLDIGSTSFVKDVPLDRRRRYVMRGTAVFLGLIWITIALTKLNALLFVTIILGAGLALREYTRRQKLTAGAAAQPGSAPTSLSASSPPAVAKPAVLLGKSLLVATRGYTPALQFALEEARARGASLHVLYIREVVVQGGIGSSWEHDPDARDLFNRLRREAADVSPRTLYTASDSPADTIIDIAATFGVDTVILGGSRRARLVHLLKGNIVARVAAHLPDSMRLIVIG
jgi:amino acid transporter/nucleotide-binding universal stress UspA family protein